jgi:hypothetical protein
MVCLVPAHFGNLSRDVPRTAWRNDGREDRWKLKDELEKGMKNSANKLLTRSGFAAAGLGELKGMDTLTDLFSPELEGGSCAVTPRGPAFPSRFPGL